MVEKKSIVYFQQNPVWGACEEYLQILIEGVKQKRHGWHITLVCPPETLGDWRQVTREYVEVKPFAKSLTGLIRQFRQFQMDILHINDPSVKALTAARLVGVSDTVLTYHTPALDINYNWKGELMWKFGKKARNLRVIALSKNNKRLLTSKYNFPNDRVYVVPHGLQEDKFAIKKDRTQIREGLAIPRNALVLICVGRLAAQKAHHVLLDAFSRITEQNSKELYLLLVGEGNKRSELERKTKKLGLQNRVYFLGYRNDVPDLLNAADLFVLSSDFEGLPFVILEAMAMGLPVVATAVDGVKDVLDAEVGILVPPRDPESFADAALKLLAHPGKRKQMARNAKQRFKQNYTADRMVEQTLKVYQDAQS